MDYNIFLNNTIDIIISKLYHIYIIMIKNNIVNNITYIIVHNYILIIIDDIT